MLHQLGGLAAVAMTLVGQPLFAHDVWIEPTTFSPKPGQLVGVRLRVGENLHGDPMSIVPGLVNQFIVESAIDRKPIHARARAEEAGVIRIASPGMQIIGYRSNRSAITLDANKFTQYLKEERLDAIVDLRARRNEADADAREVYSRCAKSLVLAGSPNEAQGDRTLGFTLELLAERNPYTIAEGENLPVRLTFQGQPLAGALVVAMNSRNPAEKQAARTDVEGRVRFRTHPGGMWLIKSVHMVPAPAGTDAEWESFWASLTFEVPAMGIERDQMRTSQH
ncbi:MAG: DUF4198 domain-containing protein [Burkholderiales bacterium]